MVEKTCPNCKTILTETTGYQNLLLQGDIETWTCMECGYFSTHTTGMLSDDELENLRENVN